MNVWSVAALGVGSMVGAGIFALLGQAALVAGADTWLAFAIGGVVAILSGYSFAKLAARYPKAGGITEYFDEGFGVGRISGTLSLIYLVTLVVSVAMVARAFGAYAADLFGLSQRHLVLDGFASFIVIALYLLNLAKSDLVGRAELLLVAVKLCILALLAVAGADRLTAHAGLAHPHASLPALLGSVGLTFFAYAGYGTMTNAAESVPRPERTIPRAIYLAIGSVIVLYVVLAVVVLAGVSAPDLAANADTAVAEAARPVLGDAGFIAVSIAALAATASAINATLFSARRIARALAEQGHLPPMFGDEVWHTATAGDLVGVGLILVMTNLMDLSAIASVAGAVYLIIYLMVHVVNWRLIAETRAARPVIAVGAVLMGVVLVAFLSRLARTEPWLLGMIVLLVGGCAVAQPVSAHRARAREAAGSGNVD
jgi:amino acid transporter